MGKMKKIYIYIERERERERQRRVLKWKRLGGREKRTGFGRKRFLPKGNGFHLKKKKKCYERENENGEERNECGFKKLGERK